MICSAHGPCQAKSIILLVKHIEAKIFLNEASFSPFLAHLPISMILRLRDLAIFVQTTTKPIT